MSSNDATVHWRYGIPGEFLTVDDSLRLSSMRTNIILPITNEVDTMALPSLINFCAFKWRIELYARKYSVSQSVKESLSIAYWVWIRAVASVIIVGEGYFKYFNSSGEKSGQNTEKKCDNIAISDTAPHIEEGADEDNGKDRDV